MNRDIAHYAINKLQGDWSAPDFAKSLTKEALATLVPRFEKLDALVRVRLLLSALLLPPQARTELAAELQDLAAAAREDKEEWVGVIGRAVDGFSGRLSLDAVLEGHTAVRDTMAQVQAKLSSTSDATFRPLQEVYLSRKLVERARGRPVEPPTHNHFRLRHDVLPTPSELTHAAAAVPGPASSPAQPAPAPAPAASSVSASTSHHRAGPAALVGRGVLGRAKADAAADMFLSSRPAAPARPPLIATAASAAADRGERRGAARAIRTKQIDVGEAIALAQPATGGSTPAAGGSTLGVGGLTPTPPHPAEREDGELEDGELPDSPPPAKRLRS